jgi:glycosyltransferase involved in cell wall biosynthesis
LNIFNFKAISTKHLFTKKKIAIVSVINDLVTDVRVNKACMTLIECNYNVLLIGRELPNSLPILGLSYNTYRFKLWFKKGPLFYFVFNLKLLFKLLFLKADLLYANDLDTLLPNYLIARLKKIPLVYDSHELFCEVPELKNSPIKKRIWLWLENTIVPKLKNNITVSTGIAQWFKEKYKTNFVVVRNIPEFNNLLKTKSRQELNLPIEQKIILLQGAGINIDRGAEELVEAMQFVNNAMLYIIGGGDVWGQLKKTIHQKNLQSKVVLIEKLPKQELMHYTANADLGLSIDKNTNLNYYFSLPNKLFDYIYAEIPILASRLKEIESIINDYSIGEFIDNHNAKHMAERINSLLHSPKLAEYKQNTYLAKQALKWEIEKEKLINTIQNAVII